MRAAQGAAFRRRSCWWKDGHLSNVSPMSCWVRGIFQRGAPDRFARSLAVITLLGLAVRLVYVLGFRRNVTLGGDALFYHWGADLLAHGKGFIGPFQYHLFHIKIEAADHPPLYMLFLSIPSVLGIGTVLQHMLWSALLGTATVTISGLVGRHVGGTRVGLLSAAIVAVYPNVWVYDGQVLSETMAIFLATLALLVAYRALESPRTRRVVILGLVCGLAALSRSELALLVPALLWPIAALDRTRDIRGRFGLAAVGTLAAVLVVLPWAAYNLTRFEHPVLLSSQLGATVAGANCDDTYYGAHLGLFSYQCPITRHPHDEDESVTEEAARKIVRTYIGHHLSRLPVVAAARVGRVLELYRPAQQTRIDEFVEDREQNVEVAGLVTGYLLAIGAIAGGVITRRRRERAVFPLVVMPAIALFTVAAMYANPRFRAVGETSLAILTAVAIDALWRRLVGTDIRAARPSLADDDAPALV
jgi:4-amino-4-deoxy-L-arabinose transferase-like glycosyltransferase